MAGTLDLFLPRVGLFLNTPDHYAPFAVLLLALLLTYSFLSRDQRDLPSFNAKKFPELTVRGRVKEFFARGKDILLDARAQASKRPYKLVTDIGQTVVIPPEFAHELRSHPQLDFIDGASDDTHGYIPGFDPFAGDHRLPGLVTKYLTKALAKLTQPISHETSLALQRVLTDSTEWHEIKPGESIISIVSQMSSRVFMGEGLCRNMDWVEASADYTVAAFRMVDVMAAWPRSLRPWVHWLLPDCWELRRKLERARAVLKPHIEQRHALKAAADGPVKFDDAIEWFEREYGEGVDHATTQITLSLVAMHTTSDLLVQTMIELAQNPELLAPLREEIKGVLSSGGLDKTSLYNLKLMDSVVKETQRRKPILMTPFKRKALQDIELSDGTKIYKGERVATDVTHMWNAAVYEGADKFDGYRFLRQRESAGAGSEANAAHLVSTSWKHLGFGHGQHACPGRFFAANEIKIALCHLLLKYDWAVRLPEGATCEPVAFGANMAPSPHVSLDIRRRPDTLHLDVL